MRINKVEQINKYLRLLINNLKNGGIKANSLKKWVREYCQSRSDQFLIKLDVDIIQI